MAREDIVAALYAREDDGAIGGGVAGMVARLLDDNVGDGGHGPALDLTVARAVRRSRGGRAAWHAWSTATGVAAGVRFYGVRDTLRGAWAHYADERYEARQGGRGVDWLYLYEAWSEHVGVALEDALYLRGDTPTTRRWARILWGRDHGIYG